MMVNLMLFYYILSNQKDPFHQYAQSIYGGEIKKYDFKTQAADVQIDIKELYFDGSHSDYPSYRNTTLVLRMSYR